MKMTKSTMLLWVAIGLIVLAAFCTKTPAQTVEMSAKTVDKAREHFERFAMQVAAIEAAQETGQSLQVLPGEESLFALHAGEFYDSGDEARVSAQVLTPRYGSVITVGRIKPAGADGEPIRDDSAFEYFIPKMGVFGFLPNVPEGKLYRDVFTYRFKTNANSGRYVVQLLTYDVYTGVLVQLSFTNLYCNTTGDAGRHFYWIDSVTPENGILVVRGKFQKNLPYHAWVGLKNVTFDLMPETYFSADGRTLLIPTLRTRISRDMYVDVMLHDTDFRMTLNRPKSLFVPRSAGGGPSPQ